MANYECRGRSNYFKVKDHKKFKNLLEKWNLDLITKITDEGELLGFMVREDVFDPNMFFDSELDKHVQGDFHQELSDHLVDNWVAIYMEVGFEKMRYLTGMSFAVNSNGEFKAVSLGDIYSLVKDMGKNVMHCEY